MIQSAILKRLLSHMSSFTLVLVSIAVYLSGEHEWIDTWLPVNGKPLAVLSLLAIVIVYELAIYANKQLSADVKTIQGQQTEILRHMEVNRLIQAVNGMYGRFETSKDTHIDNEYSIKELSELVDMRERLNINSYTQGRLEYLVSKIKRT